MTKNRLFQLASNWMNEENYDRVISELSTLPPAKRGSRLTVLLAQAKIRKYGLEDHPDSGAPQGWKEEAIRELNFFRRNPSHDWKAVMALLQGTPLEPEPPAPSPPPPPAKPKASPPSGKRPESLKAQMQNMLQQKNVSGLLARMETIRSLNQDLMDILFQGMLLALEDDSLQVRYVNTLFDLLARDPWKTSRLLDHTLQHTTTGAWCPNAVARHYRDVRAPLCRLHETLQDQTLRPESGIRPLQPLLHMNMQLGQFWVIIATLKDRKPEEMNLNLVLTLAVATFVQYMDELNASLNGEPNRLEEITPLKDSMYDLLGIFEEEGSSFALWHLARATCWTLKKRPSQSLLCWKRAVDLSPEDPDLQNMYTTSLKEISMPQAVQSYRTVTERTWKDFRQVEKPLYTTLHADDNDRDALDRLGDAIDSVDWIHLWPLTIGKQVHIFLDPGTYPGILFELEYFCRHMPEDLRSRWCFHPMIERNGNASPDEKDAWCVALRPNSRTGTVALTLFPNFSTSSMTDEDLNSTARFDLCRAIGGMNLIRYVSSYRVTRRMPRSTVPLCDLPDEMKALHMDLFPDMDAFLHSGWTSYRVGRTSDTGRLREDITCGYTLFEGLNGSQEHWDMEQIDRWNCGSVVAGFFALPLESSGAEQKGFSLSLLSHMLASEAGPEVYQVLGWAIGREHVYLDVLAWDFISLMKAAQKCTASAPLHNLQFQIFFPNAQPFPVSEYQEPQALRP